MTEQASSGTMAAAEDGEGGLEILPGVPHEPGAHHGRRSSWVAVSIIIVGFVVGGIAMVPHPRWWLIWIGAGIVAVGSLMAATTRIFDDWY